MKVKIFSSDNTERLQERVNEFLQVNDESIDVKNILQSESVSESEGRPPIFNVTITLFYEVVH